MTLYRFPAKSPKFGTKKNRTVERDLQESPYYWWYECLRRNERYKNVCERDGVGSLKKLYQDFGDVRQKTFHKWWTEKVDENGESVNRGAYLFGEPIKNLSVREIADGDKCDDPDYLYLAVKIPKRFQKSRIRRDLSLLIDKKFAEMSGQVQKAETYLYSYRKESGQTVTQKRRKSTHKRFQEKSKARYVIARKLSADQMRRSIALYDFRKSHPELSWWKLKYDHKKGIFVVDDNVDVDRRNSISAINCRAYKKICDIIENVADGVFP